MDIWEDLNNITDFEEFNCIIDDPNIYEESVEFQKHFLIEMANVTGKFMKVEDIDFSFCFSKKNSSHAIRLKINWSRNSMTGDNEGYVELHGNYRYGQSPKTKYRPKTYEIETVRYFAKKYKVLFAAVWENKLDADTLSEYFKGRLSWRKLVNSFENIKKDVKDVLSKCRNLKELEYAVRMNNAFNMND